MASKIDAKRIAELKSSGYNVVSVFDGDPELFGWVHGASGASQGDYKARQPYRTSRAQAWVDCEAYVMGRMPIQPEPDWNSQAGNTDTRGKLMEAPVVSCKACGGSGKVATGISHYPFATCGACGGVGRGVMEVVPCSACNGAKGVPCSRCNGSGVMRRLKTAGQ